MVTPAEPQVPEGVRIVAAREDHLQVLGALSAKVRNMKTAEVMHFPLPEVMRLKAEVYQTIDALDALP